MARTRAQWKVIIKDYMATETSLAGLTSTSASAEHALWVNILSLVAMYVDGLFDLFRADVDTVINAQSAHTLQWYVTKAKAFQYGVTLPADTDVYAVVPPADEAVLIVTSAAGVEQAANNKVRLKVAKGLPGALEPLSGGELAALNTYIKRIKDAGVRVEATTGEADDLRMKLQVYYDPLVLTATGERIDGTSTTPVKDAIGEFLSSLPFNGVFVLNDLIDYIEAVEGVVIAHVLVAQANYASLPYVDIPVRYTPDAGYMVLNTEYFDDNVEYTPN